MLRLFLIFGISFLLSACGGGGGGNASSGAVGSGGSNSGSNGMAFSPSTVSYVLEYGTSQTFGVGATPENPQEFATGSPIYVEIVDPQGVLEHNQIQPATINGKSAYALLHISPSLAVGEYQGAFQVLACSDSACANQLPGSPWSLPYDIQIKYILATDPAQTVNAGGLTYGGAPETVVVPLQGTGLTWSVSSDVSWLKSSPSSGSGSTTLNLTVDPATLMVGTHTGHLSITSTDGQSVTETVNANVIAAQALDVLRIGPGVLYADSGDIATGAGMQIAGPAGVSWTLSSSVSWLVPVQASGTFPSGPIEADVDASGLAPGNYTGNLVVTSADGQSGSTSVSLTVYPAGTPLISVYAGLPIIQGATAQLPPISLEGLATTIYLGTASIASDGAGNFYVSGAMAGNSYPQQSMIVKFGPNRSVSDFGGGACNSLAANSSGTVLCGFTYPANIYKITSSSSTQIFYNMGAEYASPIALDSSGNVFFVSLTNLDTIGSNGFAQFVASLGNSVITQPPSPTYTKASAMTYDQSGNLIVADYGNLTIRKVTPGGVVTVLAGQPGVAGTADGTASTATFQGPVGIAMNAAGDFYVLDAGTPNLLRKVTAQGVVTTIGGAAGNGGFSAGPLASGSLPNTQIVVVGDSLYFLLTAGVGVVSHLP